MYLDIIFVVGGFVLLLVGADWLVKGASAIAKSMGVSDLVIGLTVVAFGTSMPEMVVNLLSTAQGSTDLALTNIIGSNMINTFVILGVTALIWPVASQASSRKLDIPMGLVAAGLLFGLVVEDKHLPGGSNGLARMDGIILLGIFCWYMGQLIRKALKNKDTEAAEVAASMPWWKAAGLLLVGLAGLVGGGELIVKGAVDIAQAMGVSEAVIGLTVVALGTSLPELATSAVAAFHKNSDLALGNVLGSNIFNVFLVLGLSSTIRPLPGYDGIELDVIMVALGSVLTWVFVMTNREKQIKRWAGLVFLLVYGGYLFYRLSAL